jgi:hypothetical protein
MGQFNGWLGAGRKTGYARDHYPEPRLATAQGLIYQNHIKTHANGAIVRLPMQQQS